MLVTGLISIVLGTFVLAIVNGGITLLWLTVPEGWGEAPAWYVVGLLLLGAVLVYIVRRFIGDTGHSPLAGITVSPLTPKAYVSTILAIIASLWAGVALGPEVALVATGSLVAGIVARVMHVTDPVQVRKVVGVGALGGLLSLFVGPVMDGSLSLGPSDAVDVAQYGWAIPVALVAAIVVTIARLVAGLLSRATGGGPHLPILIGAAVVVAGAALIVQENTELPVSYIATSGEELIAELPKLTSLGAVLSIIVFKAIAYAVSLGSGFRGGPFLPAMFVGGSVGLAASLAMTDGPSVAAGISVGVVAAVIATAPMSWKVALILGVVLGYLMGSWVLVPATVIGAIVARAIPRWGDRLLPAHH